MELDLVDLFGNKINTMAAFSLVESELDGFVGIVVNLHEVTEYKKLVSTFENLANYDKLTKIPNRRLFFEKLKAAIEEYKIINDGKRNAGVTDKVIESIIELHPSEALADLKKRYDKTLELLTQVRKNEAVQIRSILKLNILRRL